MLSVKSYPDDLVTASQTRFVVLLDAYRRFTGGVDGGCRVDVHEFGRLFVHTVVISLDASFVHRVRAQEGKDGNPLNEVRMLADSILTNDGTLARNTTIEYVATRSVTGIDIGQPIDPGVDTLYELVVAVHDEIRRRYPH